MIGRTIEDQYQVLEKIGEGGFGGAASVPLLADCRKAF